MMSKERVSVVYKINLASFLRCPEDMSSLIHRIRSFLTPCLHCGSLVSAHSPLCKSCFEVLKNFEGSPLFANQEGPFPYYSYYEWNPEQSDILSALLLSLKGPRTKARWLHFAPLFVQRRLGLPLEALPICIVPAPSSDGTRDHAYLWGEALAEHLQAKFVPCLRKSQKRRQRGANRDQRLRARLQLDENYTDLPRDLAEVLWVFVDDILTTGATAHAAYEALGSPPHFEVWVLARRSLSCGASRYLL